MLENDDDSSSEEEVEVLSIHDSSSDDSSALEDFDEMWEKHVAQQQQQEQHGTLATQPPPKVQHDKKRVNKGTPVPTSVDTFQTSKTPESVTMSTMMSQHLMESTDKKLATKKPPKVSLSPQPKKKSKPRHSGSHVTMLEAVTTAAVKTREENYKLTAKKPVEDSLQNKTASKDVESKKSKPKPSHVATTDKDTANSNNNNKKDHVQKNSSSEQPSTSKSEAKPSSAKKKKKRVKKESVAKSSSVVKSDKPPATAKPKESDAPKLQAAKRKTPPEDTTTITSTKLQPLNKKKKRTFQDELVYKMLMDCKPFTLKSLAHSLHTTEAAIHHVMLSLVDKNIVLKKEFTAKGGRTNELYWANQESTAKQVTFLQLPSIEEMRRTREEYASLCAKNALLSRELTAVQQELSNDDLTNKLTELQEAVRETHDEITETKNRIASSCSLTLETQDPVKLKKRINHLRDEWKKRKTKCMDFVDQLADGMEKPVKDIVKLLQLETDEMEGVMMPPKHDI